ncbi:MAG TPA: hypothetical protein VF012_08325 [Nocardioidaceae bacterium]
MTRTAMAGALAVALSLGAAAAPAVAAPKAAHAKVAHKHGKEAKAERLLAKQVARKSAYLGRLAKANKVERLDDLVEAAVVENIERDREQLAELKADVGDVKGKVVRRELRTFRPEVYHTIINQLRRAKGLERALADVSAAGVEAQADTLAGLVELLMTYDAETKRAELRAAQRVLSEVTGALDELEDGEGADEGADEGAETTQP